MWSNWLNCGQTKLQTLFVPVPVIDRTLRRTYRRGRYPTSQIINKYYGWQVRKAVLVLSSGTYFA